MDNLRAHSVRGGTYTLISQACKFIITLATTAILARVLTPNDFGLLTMVMVVTGFVALFKDLGLAQATVQRSEVSHEQISTLFWINVMTGATMTVFVIALAPAVAWFYRAPELTSITLVMASLFLFGGLTVQHQALLRRRMEFGLLAIVEILAPAIGAATGIIAAIRGAGYWSLVAVHVTTAVCLAVGVWFACRWRPGPPVRGSGVRPMLLYGGHLTAFGVVNYAAQNVDKLLIGRFFESVAAGLYSKAYQLMFLPVQQLNTPASGVAISTLSRLQNDPDRYRAYYRRGIELLVTLGMPAAVFLFVTADSAVLLVLGEQWTEAIPILRLLAPAAFLSTFNVATGWVYQSLGRTDRQFRWGAFASIVTIGAYAIGVEWGPTGVATAISIKACVMRLPGVVYCFRTAPLQLSDLGGALWRPATASFAAGAAVSFALPMVGPTVHVLWRLAFAATLLIATYILVWCVLPNGRRTLRGMGRLALEMTGRSPERGNES